MCSAIILLGSACSTRDYHRGVQECRCSGPRRFYYVALAWFNWVKWKPFTDRYKIITGWLTLIFEVN